MDANKVNDPNGFWTNERHVHFLNNMEASFVRTMIENNGRNVARLDRYLPDSSESTADLQKDRRRRHSTSVERPRSDRRTRRPSSEPYTSSQDQVVPQLGNGNVPNPSVSPSN